MELEKSTPTTDEALDNFQQRTVAKPKSMERNTLIAVYDRKLRPVIAQDPVKPDYIVNELAINSGADKIQVFVTAKSVGGLNKFKKDYPDAEIQESAVLSSPEEWTLLGFPEEAISSTSTPLDFFYHAHGREDVEKEVLSSKADKEIKES